jgi:hypothetical protein
VALKRAQKLVQMITIRIKKDTRTYFITTNPQSTISKVKKQLLIMTNNDCELSFKNQSLKDHVKLFEVGIIDDSVLNIV